MENLNDLKLLLSFVSSFKEKSVLQLGSDSVYTQLFTQESSERPNKVVVVDSDESLLQTNKAANSASNLEFIKSEFKSLNISGQK
jgi:tRNA1(Val) A37 N6-methylase TrmN6